ncbi:hypothetical protein C6371_16105 [Bacillus atrophaeus]|nr:hypothetical protein C6371_16105 [Bacillus atrophaeus]
MFSLQFVGVFRSLLEETKHELALLLNIEEPSESVSLDQSINLFKAFNEIFITSKHKYKSSGRLLERAGI